jgi:uncharacterized iron-regulated protein
MNTAYQIQSALYRLQQRQISAQLEPPGPYFEKYAKRYARAVSGYERVVSFSAVESAIRQAQVVFVGDYHTHPSAQQTFIHLAKVAHRLHRRLIFALEFVEQKSQKILERYLAGHLTDVAFLKALKHPYSKNFSIWSHFAPIFEFAKQHRLQVLAIDSRSAHPNALQIRDSNAAKVIARAIGDESLVLCLIGQFHIAPRHLPLELTRVVPDVRAVTIYQNPEGPYFRLLKSRATLPQAIEVRRGEFGLFPSSPVSCQRSFLDYVEAENHEALVKEASVDLTVRFLIRKISEFCDVQVSAKQTKALLVTTSSDPLAFLKITRRATFSRADQGLLRKMLSSRESVFIPKARAIHLSSLSLAHAAEEAAHFVRFVAIGQSLDKPRTKRAAFWHRCLEEALAYVGVRLVSAGRAALNVQEHQARFSNPTAPLREISACVVAIAAALESASILPATILPLRKLSLFHSVSHALGHVLGESIFARLQRRRFSKQKLHALFCDPFDAPEETFRVLWCQKDV